MSSRLIVMLLQATSWPLLVMLLATFSSSHSRSTASAWSIGTWSNPRSHSKRDKGQWRVSTRSASSTVLTGVSSPQQLGSFEPLLTHVDNSTQQRRRVLLENYLNQGLVSFHDAWDRQKHLRQEHFDRLQQPQQNLEGCDRVLLVQHAPIYTLGTGSDEKYILGRNEDGSAPAPSGIPTVRMDRGGEVTYHGPGQLVVYPVLDLRHYRQDIHWYMRALEEVVLRACHRLPLSHPAERQDDTTGIWIDNRKVAAMGIQCRRWITQHGLAVNVLDSSLEGFRGIVPCGLEGRQVGCLNQFLETPITLDDFAECIREALEEVFCITLVEGAGH